MLAAVRRATIVISTHTPHLRELRMQARSCKLAVKRRTTFPPTYAQLDANVRARDGAAWLRRMGTGLTVSCNSRCRKNMVDAMGLEFEPLIERPSDLRVRRKITQWRVTESAEEEHRRHRAFAALLAGTAGQPREVRSRQ